MNRKHPKIFLEPYFKYIFIALVFLLLFVAVIELKRREIVSEYLQDTVMYGESVTDNLTQNLNYKFNAPVDGIIAYVQGHHEQIDSVRFMSFLYELRSNYNSIAILNLVKDSTIWFVEPIAGNESAINFYLPKQKKEWEQTKVAIKNKTGIILGPVNLVQGGTGLIYKKPIYIDEVYWGMAVSLFKTDSLLSNFIEPYTSDEYELAIRVVPHDLDPKGFMFFGDSALFENTKNIFIGTNIQISHGTLL